MEGRALAIKAERRELEKEWKQSRRGWYVIQRLILAGMEAL
jgi:hypothetical protein